MGQFGFLDIGRDPDIGGVIDGEYRLSGRDDVAGEYPLFGDDAVYGRYDSGAAELGFKNLQLSFADLDLGLGDAVLDLSRFVGLAVVVELFLGDAAALEEFLGALVVAQGLFHIDLGQADRILDLFQGGQGLLLLCAQVGVIQVDQRLSGLDQAAFVHGQAADALGKSGAERHVIGLDICVVGGERPAHKDVPVPGQADQPDDCQYRQQGEHPFLLCRVAVGTVAVGVIGVGVVSHSITPSLQIKLN